jgi:hypothetical protein
LRASTREASISARPTPPSADGSTLCFRVQIFVELLLYLLVLTTYLVW